MGMGFWLTEKVIKINSFLKIRIVKLNINFAQKKGKI